MCNTSFAGDLPATLVAAAERELRLKTSHRVLVGGRYPRRICRALRDGSAVTERLSIARTDANPSWLMRTVIALCRRGLRWRRQRRGRHCFATCVSASSARHAVSCLAGCLAPWDRNQRDSQQGSAEPVTPTILSRHCFFSFLVLLSALCVARAESNSGALAFLRIAGATGGAPSSTGNSRRRIFRFTAARDRGWGYIIFNVVGFIRVDQCQAPARR